MELLHKTIAQLPQSHEASGGAGGLLQGHPDRPASPSLAKVTSHPNASATNAELSPSYDQKIFETPTTQVRAAATWHF